MFQRFIPDNPKVAAPQAMINVSGNMTIDTKACKIYNLTQYLYFIAFYDKDTNRIGIMFTSNCNQPGVQDVKRTGGSITLPFSAFVKEYGINDLPAYFAINKSLDASLGGMLVLTRVEK